MATVTKEPASARRVLLASLVGTAVEFYDFYVYATAASLVFGALFFIDAPYGRHRRPGWGPTIDDTLGWVPKTTAAP